MNSLSEVTPMWVSDGFGGVALSGCFKCQRQGSIGAGMAAIQRAGVRATVVLRSIDVGEPAWSAEAACLE